MKHYTGMVALAVAGLILTACSSEPETQGGAEIQTPSADASGTLTVWLMDNGDSMARTSEVVNDQFKKTYPDVNVQVEVQQWDEVQDKLTASLATESTPDVVEIGNTLTAKYAAAGLLADLSGGVGEFGLEKMLPGPIPSGEWEGKRYGVPLYGGVTVVVYNRSQFKEADVEAPTTIAELEAVAAQLQGANAKNPDYSAFHFPGAYWQGALPFIWASGGDIAVRDGDDWRGALDSGESRNGLTFLKGLVDAYSKAPKDGDETKNLDAFNAGNVGMMIDSWWVPGVLDTGKLEGDVGAFVLPGVNPDQTAPVFFRGSDLAVSEKSSNKGLALEWVKIMTAVEAQTEIARNVGVIPNQAGAFAGHEGNEFLTVADSAATVSKFTPVSPNWGNVESARVLQDMLVGIFTGAASVEDATTTASEAITSLLNG